MFIDARFQHSTIDNYFKLFLSSTNFKYSIEWTGENLNSISAFRIARSIRLRQFLFVKFETETIHSRITPPFLDHLMKPPLGNEKHKLRLTNANGELL